jgi:hypothetical protein
LSRSACGCASLVFGLASVVSTPGPGSHGFDPPPPSLHTYSILDLEVFNPVPSSETSLLAPTIALDYTAETGLAAIGPVRACHGAGCFASAFPDVARCRSCARPPRTAPPVRFCVPLATSPRESGLPELASLGIFRPWAFSTLRRLTPPRGQPVLFHTGTTYRIQRTRTALRRSLRFEIGSSEDLPVSKTPSSNVLSAETDRVDLSLNLPRALPFEQAPAFCRMRQCVTHLDVPQANHPGRRAHRHVRGH